MAIQVPRVSNPQVRTQALPNVQQNIATPPAAFGAEQGRMAQQVGGDLSQVSNQLANTAIKIQEQQTADEVFQADSALQTAYLDFQTAESQNKGTSAWGATDRAKQWFEKEAPKYGEALSTDRGKRLYMQSAQRLQMSGVNYFSRFELDERDKSLAASADARMTSAFNIAAADPIEANIAMARKQVETSIGVAGQINGWDKDVIASKVQQNLGVMHQQILQGLIENDPLKAQVYLDTYRGEIPGTMQAELDKGVRIGTAKVRAQELGDQIMASDMDQMTAIATIHKEFSGDEEDIFLAEVNSRFAEKNAAISQAERAAADQAWDIISKGGNMADVPTGAIMRMDPRARISLADYALKKSEGKAIKTDPTVYDRLNKMSANDPEAFGKADLLQFTTQLSESDWQRFSDLQRDYLKPDKDNKIAEVATLSQQLDVYHEKLGITGADKEGTKAASRGKFDQAAQVAISAEQKQKGRELTYEERQKILDRLIAPGVIKEKGWLFDSETDALNYEVEGTANEQNFEIVVPDDDTANILAKMKVKGLAPQGEDGTYTDEQIMQIYRKAKGL